MTPHEISVYSENFKNNNMWVNIKSSIDPEVTLTGRPYGGIGFIAKKLDNIIYKPISVDSDRVIGVQIVSGDKVLLTVFGVYLPYYKGTIDQIHL